MKNILTQILKYTFPPLSLIVILAGCASAPSSYTDLPLAPLPAYNKADLPKLPNVFAKLAGKMYKRNATRLWLANSDSTALYGFDQQSGKWWVNSVTAWSVYHRAYCLINYKNDTENTVASTRCAIEMDDDSVVMQPTAFEGPSNGSPWGDRISIQGNELRNIGINFRNGTTGSGGQVELKPVTLSQPEISSLIAMAEKLEAKFQAQVSYPARDAARLARWHNLREEDHQRVREYNAFMSGLYNELQDANREADQRVADSTASLNQTLARLREQDRKQQIAASSAAGQQASASTARVSNRIAATPAPAAPPNPATHKAAQQNQAQVQVERATAEQARKAEASAVKRRAAEDAQQRQANAAEEKRRQAAETQDAAREREIDNYLTRLRSSIRLAAKSCGKGDIRIGGTIPSGKKPLELVKVNYVGHCPGNVRFTGHINQYIGDGISCVGSDMRPANDLPCRPEQARFEIESVTRSD